MPSLAYTCSRLINLSKLCTDLNSHHSSQYVGWCIDCGAIYDVGKEKWVKPKVAKRRALKEIMSRRSGRTTSMAREVLQRVRQSLFSRNPEKIYVVVNKTHNSYVRRTMLNYLAATQTELNFVIFVDTLDNLRGIPSRNIYVDHAVWDTSSSDRLIDREKQTGIYNESNINSNRQ